MKLLNGEIFEAKPALDKLIEKELPVKVSYELAKMSIKLNEQFNVIEKVRLGLVKKHGEKDEETQRIQVKEDTEKFTEFVGEFNELMAQEVELVIGKVAIPADELKIEPKILMPLVKLVEVK